MAVTEELIPDLLVVKRDGKKVEFNGQKVALAIKKVLTVSYLKTKKLENILKRTFKKFIKVF